MGDERPHAARLGERQRLSVVDLTVLGVEPVGMGRDVGEQVQRIGSDAMARRRRCDRAFAQTLRLIEPVEQQSGTTQHVVVHQRPDSPHGLTLEELLALPKPAQRLARLTEVRQDPGGGGYRVGEVESDIPRSDHRDRVLNKWESLRPVTFSEVYLSSRQVGPAGGEWTLGRLGEPEQLGRVRGRVGESAEFDQAID